MKELTRKQLLAQYKELKWRLYTTRFNVDDEYFNQLVEIRNILKNTK